MEETEPAKEWFVTHDGKQFGPVSLADLKFEAERGQLNPRLDMVWKQGMEDWIPAGEVDGLFVRNEEAKAAEEVKAAFTDFTPEMTEAEKKLIKGEWTGVGRGTYLFVCYILPILWGLGVGFGMKYLEAMLEPGILALVGLALFLVPVYLVISATLKRFQNLGMSRVWFLGLFAPFLNLWVWYRLSACPPGYAHHKKLDPIGWVLAIIHWGSLLLFIAGFGFVAYTLTQAGPDDPMRKAIEESMRKYEEAQKAGEER